MKYKWDSVLLKSKSAMKPINLRVPLIACFFFTALTLVGQNLDDFTRLKSSGPVPAYFQEKLEEKINQENRDLKHSDDITMSNARDFAAVTNYKLDKLIKSGRLLYGDPLTNFAQGVMDKILDAYDSDVKEIQVYTLRSAEVNAFATHQGVIIITVGLFAQIENEAQLAFILAHELTHVTEDHNLLSYQHTDDLIKSTNSWKSSNNVIESYYSYSKENELTSDKEGLELMMKAGYSPDDALGVFNVLLYSYLPIDEIPFGYEWLESEGFKIPEDLYIEELASISAEEDVDDEFHTHPNIKSRKKEIGYLTEKEKGGSSYIIYDESKFRYVRNVARFELNNIFIRNREYVAAVYNTYVLQKEFPDNKFLINCNSMSLYAMSAYCRINENDMYEESYRKKEGESQAAYYLFYKLKADELAVLATKYIWTNALLDSNNTYLASLKFRMIDQLVKNQDETMDLDYFFDEYKKDVEVDTTQSGKLSKYDKIAKKKKTQAKEDYLRYAFVDFIKNQEFREAFHEAYDDEDAEAEVEIVSNKPRESNLDIETLIMLRPKFGRNDTRKSVAKNVENNRKDQNYIITETEMQAERIGVDLKYLDDFENTSFTTEEYNEFCLMTDYIMERLAFDGQGFQPYSSQFTSELSEKYNSKHVGIMTMYTEIERKAFSGTTLFLSILVPYVLPVYFVWQFTPYKDTDYYFVVFNLESDNLTLTSSKYFKNDLNPTLMRAHLYNSLNQISK